MQVHVNLELDRVEMKVCMRYSTEASSFSLLRRNSLTADTERASSTLAPCHPCGVFLVPTLTAAVRPSLESTVAKKTWFNGLIMIKRHHSMMRTRLNMASRSSFAIMSLLTFSAIITRASCPREKGFCVTSNGGDQNSGVIKINSISPMDDQAQANCLAACQSYSSPTGQKNI